MTNHLSFTEHPNPGAPALVLIHSLGLGPGVFDRLRPLISEKFHVVEATLPGHTGTPVASGPFSVEDLAREVAHYAHSHGWDTYGYLGVSIGGAIGLVLSRIDTRLAGAICVSSAASFGSPQTWHERAETARNEGTTSFVEQSRGRWFASAFLEQNSGLAEDLLRILVTCDGPSYAHACEALSAFDFTTHRGSAGRSVLIMNGSDDALVTPEAGAKTAELVDKAEAKSVDGVAHLGPFEKPEKYSDSADYFLMPLIAARSRQ